MLPISILMKSNIIGTILVYDMSSGSEKTYKVTDHKVVEITAE